MTGVPVGRLLGFEIRIHVSWVFILSLVTVLAVSQIEEATPSLAAPVRWAVAALIAGAFLVSVLAHELGHAVVARRRGIPTGPIVLYFFGGGLQVETERPADEVAVAGAGPLVSLVAGVALLGGALLLAGANQPALEGVGVVAMILGALNLILGLVNLVPGFPLDGGRIVRGLVWRRTGDERRGARAAGWTGRGFGWGLVVLGVSVILTFRDFPNGLMLVLCGWFLANAAKAVDRRIVVEDLLRDVRVDEVMERDVPTVPPQLTVDTFAERVGGAAGSAVAVVRDAELLGLIGPSQLRRLGRRSWTTTRAEEVMVGGDALPRLAPDETVWAALDRLRRTGLDALPVVDPSGLLGLVTRTLVATTIQARAKSREIVIP